MCSTVGQSRDAKTATAIVIRRTVNRTRGTRMDVAPFGSTGRSGLYSTRCAGVRTSYDSAFTVVYAAWPPHERSTSISRPREGAGGEDGGTDGAVRKHGAGSSRDPTVV